MVGEHDAFGSGEIPERKACDRRGDCRGKANRQGELDRELEIDIEELGTQRDRSEVGCEMGHIDAPCHRSFDLGAAFPAHFIGVGVLPQIVDGARKSTLTRDEARRMGDRTPAVEGVFGVESEMNPDIFTLVHRRGMTGPGSGHHDGCTRGETLA
jgi:hypothetical protein